MNIKTTCAAVAAALMTLAGAANAAEIYPVDKARSMTNARFDFKVELDQVVDRKDISVEINGKDYRKTLSGAEIFVPQEMDAPVSAVIVRDVEIKKPGRYEVVLNNSPLKREGFDQIKTLPACGCPQTGRHPDHETLFDAVLVRSRVLRRAAGIA